MIIVITVILIILLSFHRDWGKQEPNIIHRPPTAWNFVVVYTPTPESTPEFDESDWTLAISSFDRQKQRIDNGFTHFSGIVIKKSANSITIVDFFGAAQLSVLIGENTKVLIGIVQGTRNDIVLGAWVEVEGYYIEKDNMLDANAIRWDGKPGQIEIMQYNIKSP